ncbi:MAG: hypothetical protein KAT05_12910 [Spirochaetes bacterium]|nr:hypothetical protein [Spirochaetota bacterium]
MDNFKNRLLLFTEYSDLSSASKINRIGGKRVYHDHKFGIYYEGNCHKCISVGVIQIFLFLFRRNNFHQEEKNIVDYLKESIKSSEYKFRSTNIICNTFNLPEERVRNICNRSKKIRRNEKKEDTWTLKK